jgi:hypothetical protein
VSSSVQRPRAWRYRSVVSRKSIVGTPASVHRSKAVGVACLESMTWVRVTGAGQVYLSHIGGCALIGHLTSEWSPTRNHSGCLQGQYSRGRELCVQNAIQMQSRLTSFCVYYHHVISPEVHRLFVADRSPLGKYFLAAKLRNSSERWTQNLILNPLV